MSTLYTGVAVKDNGLLKAGEVYLLSMKDKKIIYNNGGGDFTDSMHKLFTDIDYATADFVQYYFLKGSKSELDEDAINYIVDQRVAERCRRIELEYEHDLEELEEQIESLEKEKAFLVRIINHIVGCDK